MNSEKDFLEAMMRDEYPKELESLRFSDEQKARMAANIEAAAKRQRRAERAAVAKKPAPRVKRPVFRHAIAAAAVVGALAVGGVAYAGGGLVSVGNLVDDVFGGAPAQTEVVDAIGRPIGAADSCNGVTVSADAIIGDARNYMIVYSIAKDDGTAFENLGEPVNGSLMLGFEGGTATGIDGVTSSGGSVRFYDADPSDNAIQMVEMMTTGGEDIIGKTARIELGDLMLLGEDGKTVVAEGDWKLKFEIGYEDASVALPAGGAFEVNGEAATVDMLSVSPIAISIDYTVGPLASELEGAPEADDSGQEPAWLTELSSYLGFDTVLVTLADGSVIEVQDECGGSIDQQGDVLKCEKGIFLPEVIDAQDVVSVTICGTEIPVA